MNFVAFVTDREEEISVNPAHVVRIIRNQSGPGGSLIFTDGRVATITNMEIDQIIIDLEGGRGRISLLYDTGLRVSVRKDDISAIEDHGDNGSVVILKNGAKMAVRDEALDIERALSWV